MEKPIISVIITVYNRESFVEKCIKSILDQNEVSMEVILVDDGSTDRSAEICKSFASLYDNVKLIQQKNAGLSVARNTGLDNARGDYICFLDDDDVMTSGSIKVMIDAMEENDVDIVIGNSERYNEDGSFLCSSNMPDNVKNRVITVDEYWTASFDRKGYFIFVVNWAKLYKRELWEGLRFPPEFRKAEDEVVLADILERCKSIYVTEYVVHRQTMTECSITRASFSLNTLCAPESKLITTEKLIRLEKYQFAVKKWGIACGEIVDYTKRAIIQDVFDEVKRLYDISVVQGKELFKHFDMNKKIKFMVYRIIYPCIRYLP